MKKERKNSKKDFTLFPENIEITQTNNFFFLFQNLTGFSREIFSFPAEIKLYNAN